MSNLTKGLPVSVKQTLIAALPLVIVAVLFALVGNFGISKVQDIGSQIKSAESDQAALNQKLSVLQTLSSLAASGTGPAVSALPDKNPALLAISQLKFIASEDGVTLSQLTAGGGVGGETGLSVTGISFSAEGTRSQIISFLTDTAKVAPLIVLSSFKISENGVEVKTDITAKSFWAGLPKTIPPVTQAISDLTDAEKETLARITNLTQPTFIQVTPSTGNINPSPFGQ